MIRLTPFGCPVTHHSSLITSSRAAALAAGATLAESLALANAAASIVIHQLGTTGSATVPQIRELLAASC
ncbi:MAG: hypothetical protein FJ388_09330 [Verrucomicrobia bacterium]|nr:hypothetical protein [Verrucomicrobiota bacterium]